MRFHEYPVYKVIQFAPPRLKGGLAEGRKTFVWASSLLEIELNIPLDKDHNDQRMGGETCMS